MHQSYMILNQTVIELFDIRHAQNYILDEDEMGKIQGQGLS